MTSNSLAVYTPEKQEEIQRLLGLKGTTQELAHLFRLAEHYDLDPLTKEISLINGPFIGVWGRLHIGHRSGMLDGIEADEEVEDDQFYKVKVIVWRKDQSRPAARVWGRVAKSEKKAWPFELARARALRAALGVAFSIHDSYDTQDSDNWQPPPDERIQATVVDVPETAAPGEEAPTQTAAKPKKRVTKAVRGSAADPDPTPGHTTGAAAPQGETTEAPAPVDVSSEGAAAPEQPTLIVGGHSNAQKLAIKARAALGDEDEQLRNQLIHYLTGGRANRATEVSDDDYEHVAHGFDGLANGTLELRYYPNGAPYLVKPGRLGG